MAWNIFYHYTHRTPIFKKQAADLTMFSSPYLVQSFFVIGEHHKVPRPLNDSVGWNFY